LQDEVVKLLEAAWRAPEAEQQRPLKAADVLHLAVNLQDPTPAAATLREVSRLRDQLLIQQLRELLQQQTLRVVSLLICSSGWYDRHAAV
jgi:hypothetical protein